MRKLLVAALSLALAAGAADARLSEPRPFDTYVLALTWSPTFCENEGRDRRSDECRTQRGFTVHGLWPQQEGRAQEYCRPQGAPLNPQVTTRMLDLMPDAGLVRHEWRRHGTCSGLDASAYFDAVRQAHGKLTIPDDYKNLVQPLTTTPEDIRAAFGRANKGLSDGMIRLTCENRHLREVRVCLSKEKLDFAPCPATGGDSCRGYITLPAH
jgi:ribonuclease T2